MNDQKQQIIDKLQAANNILVTVPSSPSVDQLSAAIGLTLLLNKMNKHATAVFSGMVPRTLSFLKPEETLEKDTDSLRDFIVALDKSKADKLRYKVEDEVVKIFITPYKSSITENDLVFSQGDFNVDVVLALGVLRQQDLDTAITAHGRILHDAVVISVNNKAGGELGSINWQETNASGLAELVTDMGIDIGKELIDEQIATALLTGIVSETDHFGNQKTTPQTMTVSAVLLAAGANQQLVAKELARSHQLPPQQQQQQKKKPQEQGKADIAQAGSDGSLSIKHKPGEKRKKEYLAPKPESNPDDDERSIEEILKSSGAVSDDEPQDVNTVITLPEPAADPFEKIEQDTDDADQNDASVGSAPESEDHDDSASAQSDETPAEETDSPESDAPATEESEKTDEPEPTAEPEPQAEAKPEQPSVELPEPDLSINDLPGFEPSPSEPAPSNNVPTPDDEPQSAPAEQVAEPADATQDDRDAPADVDEARQKVEDALKDSSDGLPQDFNAINVNLDLGHEEPVTPEVINPGGDAAMPAGPGDSELPSDLLQAPTAPGPDYGPAPAPGPAPIGATDPFANSAPGTNPFGGMPTPPTSPMAPPMPPNPAANEQAPLSGSPADQPFTMPMPGAAPAEPPHASFGRTPAGLNVPPPTQFSPTAAGMPPQGPPPPPVPPPPMPPNFIPGP